MNQQALEKYLWGAATWLRGHIDAGDYKQFIFPLLFFKRIVNDIDEIVRIVRFPGWQNSTSGQKEVQKALRKSLLKYKLHKDQILFDRAYGYIQQYY